MATSTVIERPGLKSAGLHGSWTKWNCREVRFLHDNGLFVFPILKTLLSRPRTRMSSGITVVSSIRRDKVLDLRDRIARGTYPVDALLARAMDRVLEDFSVSGIGSV
ncbi:MAG: flagellar biosynthesis anti-sigma factor FlgM [Phycisphaerae bacterium]|nr:flagellar biosynthesis anti-sigma factor FlgM [Phycisphaerae bacterium]